MTVHDDIVEVLAREPWLKPYVEDDDVDLEPARRRYAQGQRAVVNVRARQISKDGVRTTSWGPR
jgi:hypothetical protein